MTSAPTSAASGIEPTIHDAASRPSKRVKLHGRAFYESIGSPKLVLAPMVDQSEFVSGSSEEHLSVSLNERVILMFD
jgi:tRNA-dihydrouridine synthase 1